MLTMYKLFMRAVRQYSAELARLNTETGELLHKLRAHVSLRVTQTDEIMAMVARMRTLREQAQEAQQEIVDEVMNGDMPVIIVPSDDDKKN